MAEFDIPPKENLGKQLLATAILLIVVGIVVALLTKALIGFIIFLLGAIAGVGSQVAGNNSFKEK